MGYQLTEDQMGLVKMARDFAEREVKPNAAETPEKNV